MQLHQLQRKTKLHRTKRIGRGGKRGKTSGRGHKGQKQHGGHGIRPELRDTIKKLPKRRGYGKNRAKSVNDSVVKPIPVNISSLEKIFEDGADITPKTLLERKIISKKGGKMPSVKILGQGSLSKKVTVNGCLFSEKAKKEIEKAGGIINSI